MKKFMEKLDRLEDFLFKSHACMCCGTECGDDTYRLCDTCKSKLKLIGEKFCLKCGTKIDGDYDFCIECKNDVHEFDKARAIFVYDENSAPMILHFKYGGRPAYAKALGKMLYDRYNDSDIVASVVTYVPMPKEREKQRGYNQSHLLAKEFSFLSGIPLVNALVRTKNSEQQTKLSKSKRKENLLGSFAVTDKALVKGKDVLLIDDVVTTGATADECAKVLYKAGAREVSILALAKTPANAFDE